MSAEPFVCEHGVEGARVLAGHCPECAEWADGWLRDHSAPTPSEFDLRPAERCLACGCYAEQIGDTWRVTGQAFLCPEKHRLHEALNHVELGAA